MNDTNLIVVDWRREAVAGGSVVGWSRHRRRSVDGHWNRCGPISAGRGWSSVTGVSSYDRSLDTGDDADHQNAQ